MDSVYQFDLSAFRAINVGLHSEYLTPIFLLLSYSGLGQAQAILILLFWINKSTRKFVVPLIFVDIFAGVVVADGLKALVPRDRPSNLSFAIAQEPHLISSFPSGHTTLSFGVATMLAFLTWETKYRWLGFSSFVWAALVGLSRIYRGVHWPTDVLAGACLGVFSGCLVHMVWQRRLQG